MLIHIKNGSCNVNKDSWILDIIEYNACLDLEKEVQ